MTDYNRAASLARHLAECSRDIPWVRIEDFKTAILILLVSDIFSGEEQPNTWPEARNDLSRRFAIATLMAWRVAKKQGMKDLPNVETLQ